MERKNKINQNIVLTTVALLLLLNFSLIPKTARASVKVTPPPPLEISGWVPYWRTATGTADAIMHIDSFKEISPFGFTIKKDGSLFDPMGIDSAPWQALIKKAHDNKVRVIPTIMSSNADAIDAMLRSPAKRAAHIKEITKTVSKYGFDGIDIDYEGKKAETKPYFSLFLRDLYKAMGNKFVVCTIEARTPLTSRFDTIPKDIQFANDFVAINKYCDRVRIMTYDQGSIDLRLNEKAVGPYNPIADTKWVEKVINLAAKDISKKKIVIGVATYGREFEVTPTSRGYKYDFSTSFNPRYAIDIANAFGIVPQRNSAGEMSFVYIPTSTPPILPSGNITPSNNIFATTSLGVSTSTSSKISNSLTFLSWSDSGAIKEKMLLAKKLGVRGVAIFKIDGGEDPALWNVLKEFK